MIFRTFHTMTRTSRPSCLTMFSAMFSSCHVFLSVHPTNCNRSPHYVVHKISITSAWTYILHSCFSVQRSTSNLGTIRLQHIYLLVNYRWLIWVVSRRGSRSSLAKVERSLIPGTQVGLDSRRFEASQFIQIICDQN